MYFYSDIEIIWSVSPSHPVPVGVVYNGVSMTMDEYEINKTLYAEAKINQMRLEDLWVYYRILLGKITKKYCTCK